jgi:DNA-binding MarR family transcriptional regulator
MGSIVVILQAQGLVERTADSSDGRQSIVAVTDAGRRSLDQARAVKQDWLTKRLTQELDHHEQGVLAQAVPLLQRIVDFTSENPPGGG